VYEKSVSSTNNREAKATIYVVVRPQENHKPVLTVPRTKLVVAGETVTFNVSAIDPDAGQTVTIDTLRLPYGATFSSETFSWPTTLANVGTDTAVFIASDNGTPVMSDIDTVFITVSATPVNRPPVWTPNERTLSGQVGSEVSLSFAGMCSDPDDDTLIYTLLPGMPAGDTVIGPSWTFTPAAGDTGTYMIKIVARDPSDASDTLTIHLTIAAGDLKAPVMGRVIPKEDSLPVSSSSYQIVVSGRDESGIASVRCEMGSDTFAVSRSDDTLYSATVTGLSASEWNTIRMIATDSSAAANRCTLNVYLKYDATLPDNVPPTITLLSPTADTIIGVDTCTIRVRCTDDSGVAVVSMNVGSDTVRAVRGTGDVFTGTIKHLAAGQYSTVTITAMDSSAAHNQKAISVRIKYDGDVAGPVITRVTPATDSVTSGSANYTVTLQCTDASGVKSVNGAMDASNFTGTRGSGNNWTIAVTGLTVNVYNMVVFTATDSSLRANTAKDTVYIKYDPTMLDTIGPTIIQINGPASGSIVPNAAIEIVDSVGDPSDIDSVYWTRNNGAKKMMAMVSGSTGYYSLKDTLTEGKIDTLVVTGVDKATRRNRSTQTFYLRYIKAPSITTQPLSQAVCSGGQAIFTVAATGTAPLSYQWRTGAAAPFNNIGGNFPRCTLSNATATTIVSCVVSNSTNVTSNLCTLTVNTTPALPTSVSATTPICTGSTTTLTAAAPATGTLHWYTGSCGGTAVGTGTSVTTGALTSNTTFYVRAETATCNGDCATVSVTVNAAPTRILIANQSRVVCSDDGSQNISVSTSEPSISYQWYKNGTTALTDGLYQYSGSSTNVLQVWNDAAVLPGYYSCKLTNSSGCSTFTDSAHLSLSQINITQQPGDQSCCEYQLVRFSITATGGVGALHYLWYWRVDGIDQIVSNGVYFEGQGTNSLGVYGSSSTFGAGFYCVITDDNNCILISDVAWFSKDGSCP
jgi:hypothetical protein